jgi:outer membrane protein with beta-barrel domain
MKMKYTLFIAIAAAMLLVPGICSAGAQFGPEVDWNKFNNDGNDWGIGARIDAGGAVRFIGSFDYYFVNTDILGPHGVFENANTDLKFYEIGANLAFQPPSEAVHPYFGGGISFSKRTFNNVELANFFDDNKSELGFNVLGGLKFGHAVQPFVEFRGTFYHGNETFDNRFVFTGGLLF